MARSASAPPFPDRPGAWLANFRYRARNEDGQRLSPELLGFELGVSGATVRRWESGRSDPSEDDLRRFAAVCGLNSLQREFLLRAYGRAHARPAGPPEDFRARAAQLLSIPRAAFIVDELHYVRAWNSYVAAMLGTSPVCMKSGTHAMQLVLRRRPEFQPEVDIERSRAFVRMFWMWTAELCALPCYAKMLRELTANPVFEACWLSLPEPGMRESLPLAPLFDEATICGRRYRIYTTEACFPPAYRVFVYEPADEAARKLICTLEEIEGPRVSFATAVHWSEQFDESGAAPQESRSF